MNCQQHLNSHNSNLKNKGIFYLARHSDAVCQQHKYWVTFTLDTYLLIYRKYTNFSFLMQARGLRQHRNIITTVKIIFCIKISCSPLEQYTSATEASTEHCIRLSHWTSYIFSSFCLEIYFIWLLPSLQTILHRKLKFHITYRDTAAKPVIENRYSFCKETKIMK